MWRHVDGCAPAAEALGVQVSGPTKIDIGGGISVHVDMLFPQFGAKNGMVVVEDYGQLKPWRQVLLAAGYGYSVFDPPPSETYFSADELADVLADWTWNGRPEDEPGWCHARST